MNAPRELPLPDAMATTGWHGRRGFLKGTALIVGFSWSGLSRAQQTPAAASRRPAPSPSPASPTTPSTSPKSTPSSPSARTARWSSTRARSTSAPGTASPCGRWSARSSTCGRRNRGDRARGGRHRAHARPGPDRGQHRRHARRRAAAPGGGDRARSAARHGGAEAQPSCRRTDTRGRHHHGRFAKAHDRRARRRPPVQREA